MKLYLTRQLNGLYMLTALKPTFADILGSNGKVDAYIQAGEPIGMRNLCDRILILVGMNKPLKRCTTIEIELTGKVLESLEN
jgi:hypothetical protein